MRNIFFLFLLSSTLLFSASVEQMKNEKRYAFVIANGLVTELSEDKAITEAKKLESFLKNKGFAVTTAHNLDRAELIKTFRNFDRDVEANAVIALIYSGRIITDQDQTWILPAGMKLESLEQLRLSAVSFNFLLKKLQGQRPRIALGIIDGYRNDTHENTTDAAHILASLEEMKDADLLVHWNGKSITPEFFSRLTGTVGNGKDDIETVAEKMVKGGSVARIRDSAFYFNVPDKILSPLDEAWQRAVAKNSVVGYEAFLIAYPDSKYKQTAIDRIDAFNIQTETAAVSASLNASLANEQQLRKRSEKLKKMEAELKAQQEALERLKAEKEALAAAQVAQPEAAQEDAVEYVEPAEMVMIPAGVYLMGSDRFENTQPVHMVTVEQAFKMSIYEVSNKEYAAYVKATGTKYRKKKLLKNESAAVSYVSWEDANRYADWLSKMTGKHYRLPTEAEWEYAARAGSNTLYSWGNNAALAAQYGWMAQNAHGFVHTRGLLQPNAFGLFDMSGNVAEWCIDAMTPNYKGAPSVSNRAVVDEDAMKVIRGGSFKSEGDALSSAFRDSNIPTFVSEDVGFRLVEGL